MMCTEPYAPYSRPPLSIALWKGRPLDSIWRKTVNKGVEMHLSRVVQWISPNEKRKMCRCRQRRGFHLQKLLLSTAGSPRDLAFDDGEIIYFRILSDYQRLR